MPDLDQSKIKITIEADTKEAQKELDELKKDIKDVKAESDKSSKTEFSPKVAPATKQQLQNVDKALKNVSKSSAKATASSKTLHKALNALKTVTGKLGHGIKSIGSAVLSGITSPFRKATGIVSKFGSALRRVAFLRVVRGLIREITAGLKEGTSNLYQWSKAQNGTFSKSMDSMATSMQYLNNSVGAALAPTLNALAPIVENIVDAFVGFINKINELSAKLTGAKTYTVAKRVAKEYAESANDATEATEELKRSLLGFDKITKLDDNSKKKSGSNKKPVDYSSMFEEKAVSNDASLTGVFTDLADKVNSALGSIDWADVKKKAYDGAKELGEAITAGIEETDWELVGSTVSNGLTTINLAVKGFFDGLKGKSIGKAINDFFKGFNAKEVAKSAADAIDSISKVFNDALKEINFEDIGQVIADLFNGLDDIDWELISENITLGLDGLVTTVKTAIEKINWGNKGKHLSEVINGIVNVDWKSVGTTVSDAAKGILDFFTSAIANVDWETLGHDIVDFIAGIDWMGILEKGGDLIQKAVAGLTKLVIGLLKGLWDNIVEWWQSLDVDKDGKTSFKEFMDGLLELFKKRLENEGVVRVLDGLFEGLGIDFSIGATLSDTAQKIYDWVVDLWGEGKAAVDKTISFFANLDLGAVMSDAWTTAKTWVADKWEKLKTGTKTLTTSLASSISAGWEAAKTWASETWDKLKTGTKTFTTNLASSVAQGWENTKTWVTDTWNNLKGGTKEWTSKLTSKLSEGWDSAKTWITNTWDNLKGGTKEWTADLKNKVREGWDKLKEAWGNGKSYVVGKAKEWSTNLKNNVRTGWDNLTKAWNNGKSYVTGKAKEWATNLKNNVRTGWDNLKTKWADGKSYAVGKAKEWAANLKNNISNAWKTLKDNWNNGKGIFSGIKNISFVATFTDAVSNFFKVMVINLINAVNDLIYKINKAFKTNFSYIAQPEWDRGNKDRSGNYTSKYGYWRYAAKGAIITAADGGLISRQMRNVRFAVGEAGREAILPLDQNTSWIDELAGKLTEAQGDETYSQSGQIVIPVYIGGEKVSESVINDINKRTAMTGVCPIRV